jgi:acetylglutamate kinase
MSVLRIVKIGGQVVEDAPALEAFLRDFAGLDGHNILVHGGGKWVSDMSARLGIPVNMVQGRRITDAASLEVVVMMLAGVANKNIVSILQSFGCNAIGLTGADGGTILAARRPPRNGIDYGLVGDVTRVDAGSIRRVLEGGFVPVFTALTHDGSGQLLNTNADTIASSLAVGLANIYDVTRLYYCFEKRGVLLDPGDDHSVVHHIDREVYRNLLGEGRLKGGILPKIENAFAALEAGVAEVWIGIASEMKAVASGDRCCGTMLTL